MLLVCDKPAAHKDSVCQETSSLHDLTYLCFQQAPGAMQPTLPNAYDHQRFTRPTDHSTEGRDVSNFTQKPL